MADITHTMLSEAERSSIANALTAAAARWGAWADELALPDVAETFRKQAAEAERFASMFLGASSVDVRSHEHGR